MLRRRILWIALLSITIPAAQAAESFEWPDRLAKKARSLGRKAKEQGDDTYVLREGGYAITAPAAQLAGDVCLYLQLFEEDFLDLFKVKKRIGAIPNVSLTPTRGEPKVEFRYELQIKDDPQPGRSRFNTTNDLHIFVRDDGDPTFDDVDLSALQREATRAMLCYIHGGLLTRRAGWLEKATIEYFRTWDVRDDVKEGMTARRERSKLPAKFLAAAKEEGPTLQDLIQPATRAHRFEARHLGATLLDTLLTHRKAKSLRNAVVDEVAGALSAGQSVGNPLSKGKTKRLETLWQEHVLEAYAKDDDAERGE